MAILKAWSVVNRFGIPAPSGKEYCLSGRVYGHKKVSDGTEITSTCIKSAEIDKESEKLIITTQNTVYELLFSDYSLNERYTLKDFCSEMLKDRSGRLCNSILKTVGSRYGIFGAGTPYYKYTVSVYIREIEIFSRITHACDAAAHDLTDSELVKLIEELSACYRKRYSSCGNCFGEPRDSVLCELIGVLLYLCFVKNKYKSSRAVIGIMESPEYNCQVDYFGMNESAEFFSLDNVAGDYIYRCAVNGTADEFTEDLLDTVYNRNNNIRIANSLDTSDFGVMWNVVYLSVIGNNIKLCSLALEPLRKEAESAKSDKAASMPAPVSMPDSPNTLGLRACLMAAVLLKRNEITDMLKDCSVTIGLEDMAYLLTHSDDTGRWLTKDMSDMLLEDSIRGASGDDVINYFAKYVCSDKGENTVDVFYKIPKITSVNALNLFYLNDINPFAEPDAAFDSLFDKIVVFNHVNCWNISNLIALKQFISSEVVIDLTDSELQSTVCSIKLPELRSLITEFTLVPPDKSLGAVIEEILKRNNESLAVLAAERGIINRGNIDEALNFAAKGKYLKTISGINKIYSQVVNVS